MIKLTLIAKFAVALGLLAAAPPANAPRLDLDSCQDDLDRVRRAASDGSDAAEDAKRKHDEFESCTGDTQFHDRMGDGCRHRKSDYQAALVELESEMDTLDGRLRSVQDDCGYDFTFNRMSALEASQHRLESSRRRLCTSLKQLVALGVSPNNVFQNCKTNMDEQFCKACLGLK
jgi:hypothetical protein